MKHKHAEAMIEYGKDSLIHKDAYRLWEYKLDGSDEWASLKEMPMWYPFAEYRRKDFATKEKIEEWYKNGTYLITSNKEKARIICIDLKGERNIVIAVSSDDEWDEIEYVFSVNEFLEISSGYKIVGLWTE